MGFSVRLLDRMIQTANRKAVDRVAVAFHSHLPEAPFGRLRALLRRHLQPGRLHLSRTLFWSKEWGSLLWSLLFESAGLSE